MKFVNFNSFEEEISLRPSQMATLINQEKRSGAEITVVMINAKFNHGTNSENEPLIGNNLIIIEPQKNGKYASFLMSGWDSYTGSHHPYHGHFGMYSSYEDALAEADACYGAKTREEIDIRRTAHKRSWKNAHIKNFGLDK